MQEGKVAQVRYKGPFDVLRHVRTERGILGLYKGMTPTLVREVNGNAVMFGVYEYLKRLLAEAQVPCPCTTFLKFVRSVHRVQRWHAKLLPRYPDRIHQIVHVRLQNADSVSWTALAVRRG
jgi:hypothetical protein